MKLIIAIVQNADRNNLADALRRENIRHTRLNTVGGFLSQGNTTFVIGVENNQLDQTLSLIHAHCHEREVLHRPGPGALHPDAYVDPVHVLVGGATLFVLNADQMQLEGVVRPAGTI
ncbi:cyclic-di-AMP receptor [Sulfobacillus harzensis]|uniref:Uncharacterized protein n=1 Tax=Sulfobacillus harzensis TaxID=2729629 RepID=A0A7Y0Q358_9FIRM|nr:hypothetical protein [Sulfobacillus harzensis]